jgi:hypothetical protein
VKVVQGTDAPDLLQLHRTPRLAVRGTEAFVDDNGIALLVPPEGFGTEHLWSVEYDDATIYAVWVKPV